MSEQLPERPPPAEREQAQRIFDGVMEPVDEGEEE